MPQGEEDEGEHGRAPSGYVEEPLPAVEEADSEQQQHWCGDFFSPEDEDEKNEEEKDEIVAPQSAATETFGEHALPRNEFSSPSALPVSLGPDAPAQRVAERPTSPSPAGSQPPGLPAALEPLQTEEPVLRPATPPRERQEASEVSQQPQFQESKPIESDDIIDFLGKLQLVLPVPTVEQLRAARPLRRGPDEIWASQFVLQSARKKFQKWMASSEGQQEFHPHLNQDSWNELDDGSQVIYQTNGIARVTKLIVNRPAKCDKTNAPGIYQETKMLIARRRGGSNRAGLKGARSMDTIQKVKENLFYSMTSCFLYLACTANVGELGEEDTGERVFVRRSIKGFKQYWTHDFPIAKQLCQLMDNENKVMCRRFTYDPGNVDSQALVAYQCSSIRAWQTYEFDGKPPPDDAARMLIDAARSGRAAELERLVLHKRFDINCTLTEFGLFGSGAVSCFTNSPIAYGIEGTALIEAIRIGWESVVECIIGLAAQGLANLDVVCSEWNPEGAGGPGLRQRYTALDIARIYQRKDIESILLQAGAKSSANLPFKKRDNPFVVRAKQENGEQSYRDEEREQDERRYDDFSFAEFDGLKVDDEMKQIVIDLEKEIKAVGIKEKDKMYKKLALRWHPDKHPDDKKSLATRIFQWIQRHKDGASEWESKAWTA